MDLLQDRAASIYTVTAQLPQYGADVMLPSGQKGEHHVSDIVSTSRKLYTQICLVNNEMCTPSVHLTEHTFKHMVAEIEYILPAFFLN